MKYKIIIPQEEPKLSNICIKCGVDLYATEDKFVCQKHPKECKGIHLSEEPLLTHAAEQKQHIIDIMKSDEELGLYEQTKCYCGHTTYCDCGPLEEPKQECPKSIGDITVDYAIGQLKAIQKCMHLDAELAYKSLPKQGTLEEALYKYLKE
jgi:hypothetical protein